MVAREVDLAEGARGVDEVVLDPVLEAVLMELVTTILQFPRYLIFRYLVKADAAATVLSARRLFGKRVELENVFGHHPSEHRGLCVFSGDGLLVLGFSIR